MSRKLSRLVLVALVATGFGLMPLAGVDAADTRSVDAYADRFEVPEAPNPKRLDILIGDTAAWNIMEGEHTVTPVNKDRWGNKGGSDTLTGDSERYEVAFKTAGLFKYYCEIHGDPGANNQPVGMWGEINVTDPATTTTTPPATTPPTTAAPAPTTTTTRPSAPQTTAPPATSAGALTPTTPPTAPAPTTTNPPKTDKKKPPKDKEDETTTTTAAPEPPAPVDIPDEAIVPSLPSDSAVQGGSVEDPGDAPEGEAVALLKKSKRGGRSVKLLIASGLGLGALGLGTAGYKFANRSSRYFPA